MWTKCPLILLQGDYFIRIFLLFLFLLWVFIKLAMLCKMELCNHFVNCSENKWFFLLYTISKWPFTPSTLTLTFMNFSGWTNLDVEIDKPETSSFPKDEFDKKLTIIFQSIYWTTGLQYKCIMDTTCFYKGLSALRNSISHYSFMWIQLCSKE